MNKLQSALMGVILISICTTLKAQEASEGVQKKSTFSFIELGLRFMPTVSQFSMKTATDGVVKGEATLGYGVGGLLAINFTKNYGIQGEILYNSLSQKYQDQDLDREINVRYLNLPILFSANTGKGKQANLNLLFGPQFGMNVGSSIKTSKGPGSDTVTYVLATKNSDFGFAYGTGLEFMLNERKTTRLDIGFRGVYGLTNINRTIPASSDESEPIFESAKVRTKSMYVGVSFLF